MRGQLYVMRRPGGRAGQKMDVKGKLVKPEGTAESSEQSRTSADPVVVNSGLY